MRILEIVENIPNTAGEVKISYDEHRGRPKLVHDEKGSKIRVPMSLETEIYPICNGMQIIIKDDNLFYFGGTDNSPEKTPFLSFSFPLQYSPIKFQS